MSITLPKLPEPVNKHGFNCIQTLDQLRARDLEVARLVLEAAAKFIELWHLRGIEVSSEVLEIARDIRALEVSHE